MPGQMPPDTTAYMLLGYAVIFVGMLVYVASLWVRRRNLEADYRALQEEEGQEPEQDL